MLFSDAYSPSIKNMDMCFNIQVQYYHCFDEACFSPGVFECLVLDFHLSFSLVSHNRILRKFFFVVHFDFFWAFMEMSPRVSVLGFLKLC